MSSREYPDRPFVGVGVVVVKDGEVLLVRRGKEPRKGRWSIPGGRQELGETIEAAALREVREETGLEVQLTGLLDVVNSITKDEAGQVRFHYTLVDFAADWVRGAPVAGDDADRAQWVPAEQIDSYVQWGETRRLIGMALEKAGCAPLPPKVEA